MGSMWAQIKDEQKQELEGLRRKCPSCGRLMNRLPSGKWHCVRCAITLQGVKKEE